MSCGEEKSKRGSYSKCGGNKKGQFPQVFFSKRRENFEGKKVSRKFASAFCVVVCVKEKLHAKRDNKSCARVVKLLLHDHCYDSFKLLSAFLLISLLLLRVVLIVVVKFAGADDDRQEVRSRYTFILYFVSSRVYTEYSWSCCREPPLKIIFDRSLSFSCISTRLLREKREGF